MVKGETRLNEIKYIWIKYSGTCEIAMLAIPIINHINSNLCNLDKQAS